MSQQNFAHFQDSIDDLHRIQQLESALAAANQAREKAQALLEKRNETLDSVKLDRMKALVELKNAIERAQKAEARTKAAHDLAYSEGKIAGITSAMTDEPLKTAQERAVQAQLAAFDLDNAIRKARRDEADWWHTIGPITDYPTKVARVRSYDEPIAALSGKEPEHAPDDHKG